MTPHVVRQRLRLGAVSAKLIQLYRNCDLTLEQVMALAITDDQARQERVYERLSYDRNPSTAIAAEQLLAATDWLPPLLRTPKTEYPDGAQGHDLRSQAAK